jgi:hypothetical protein
MTKYYELLNILKTELEATGLVNTITQGDISGVDVNKQNLYPLAHIVINSASFVSATINFNVTILCMDILDVSKSKTTDQFRGNDNEIDILNACLTTLNRVFERFRRDYTILEIGDAQNTPFVMRFENGLAGWEMTFDVTIPANMTIC